MNRRWELQALGESLVSTAKAIPEVPENGYVVKVSFCGICHYDVEGCSNLGPGQSLPKVLGHEISGFIHSIGPKAAKERPDLKLGDAVVIFPWAFCTKCPDCLADNSAFCREGPPLLTQGFFVDGGYQDYVTVYCPNQLIQVPVGVPLDVAAISACSALTGYGAALQLSDSIGKALRIRKKASVLLIGVGGVSLWALKFIRQLWPIKELKICTVSTKTSKTCTAKEAGADVSVTWTTEGSCEDAVTNVKDACGTFDGVVDFVGTATTAERIVPLLNTCATWVMVGTFGGALPPVAQVGVVMSGIRIQGSMVGTRQQFSEVLVMLRDNKVTPPPIWHVTFDEVNSALERLDKGDIIGRAVIAFD